MKNLVLLIALFSQISFGLTEQDRVNRIFANAGSSIPFPWVYRASAGYERVLSSRISLGVGAVGFGESNFGREYSSASLEVASRFFLWGHGIRAFEKGFLARVGIGVGIFEFEKPSQSNISPQERRNITNLSQEKFREGLSLNLGLNYNYTFNSGFFLDFGLTVNALSVIFPSKQSSAVVFASPNPTFEISVGYAFCRCRCPKVS